MIPKYIEPLRGATKFTCPSCWAISQQGWVFSSLAMANVSLQDDANRPLAMGTCTQCEAVSVWLKSTMLSPDIGSAPAPLDDLPGDVQELYREAASISNKSSRAAAALLRLALDRLIRSVAGMKGSLNDMIGQMVKDGLPKQVRQALDVLRVTGNNAVHSAGEIQVDDLDTVAPLFVLINLIGEYQLELPRRVDKLFSALPESALEQIQKRDNQE